MVYKELYLFRVTYWQNLLRMVDTSTSLDVVCLYVNSVNGNNIFELQNKC